MSKQYFDISFYEFFLELSLNNQKSWFDENRKRYENDVKQPFINFISDLLVSMSKFDIGYQELTAKDCLFRINKDIRFSKDKSPYKLHCSASLHIGGRKKMWPGGMYIELGAESCGIYSGVYMPEKDDLLMFRNNIANNLHQFDIAINDSKFIKYFGEVLGSKNKIIDATLKEAAAKQPLIFNKQFYVAHTFEPEKSFDSDFINYLIDVWRSAMQFNTVLAGKIQ
jgi:uncharacterized protein (TIGR02453 family)